VARQDFSPPQLFASWAIVAGGALLVAERPGTRAVIILDWPRLFLLAGLAVAVLFLAERWLSRRVRKESRAYPYHLAVLFGLFGLSVALASALNASFARRPPRVLRPTVRAWERAKPPTAERLPLEQAQVREVIAVVESWRDPGEELRIPVSVRAQEEAGPGPHLLEVIAPPGLLGVEYVETVRLVAP
jgi:hypothetical protein